MGLIRTREIAGDVTKSQTEISSLPLCVMAKIFTPWRAQHFQV
jgi:hypothetical protein